MLRSEPSPEKNSKGDKNVVNEHTMAFGPEAPQLPVGAIVVFASSRALVR